MTNITLFNSLTRQLLIHLGDEKGTNLILNALNTKKKIKILRSLAFNHKTTHEMQQATGINKVTLQQTLQQLVELGVIESKGTTSNRRKGKGGRKANVWGLV